jgi:hypothetical protein
MKLLHFNKENPDCFETSSIDSPLSALLNTLHLEPHTPLKTACDVRTSMVPPPEPHNQNHPNKQGRHMKVVVGTKQHTIRAGKTKMKGARHHRQRLVIGSKEQYKTLLSLQGNKIVSKWRRQEHFSSRSTTCSDQSKHLYGVQRTKVF